MYTKETVGRMCQKQGHHVQNWSEIKKIENSLLTWAISYLIKDETSLDCIFDLYPGIRSFVDMNTINHLWKLLSQLYKKPIITIDTTNDVFLETVTASNSLYIFIHKT